VPACELYPHLPHLQHPGRRRRRRLSARCLRRQEHSCSRPHVVAPWLRRVYQRGISGPSQALYVSLCRSNRNPRCCGFLAGLRQPPASMWRRGTFRCFGGRRGALGKRPRPSAWLPRGAATAAPSAQAASRPPSAGCDGVHLPPSQAAERVGFSLPCAGRSAVSTSVD
jgi:hypothetical protein